MPKWNVYVVDMEGKCLQVNSVPYTPPQVAAALQELKFPVNTVLLVPQPSPPELQMCSTGN